MMDHESTARVHVLRSTCLELDWRPQPGRVRDRSVAPRTTMLSRCDKHRKLLYLQRHRGSARSRRIRWRGLAIGQSFSGTRVRWRQRKSEHDVVWNVVVPFRQGHQDMLDFEGGLIPSFSLDANGFAIYSVRNMSSREDNCRNGLNRAM